MRVSLKELMDKLGVGHEMGAYETYPWSCYDADEEMTCSAEVRMGPEGRDVEAEVQIMPDIPSETRPPMEQICLIRAIPVSGDLWNVRELFIKGAPFDKKEEVSEWEDKACELFKEIVQELALDNIPDMDRLIRDILSGRGRKGMHGGEGGGKSPKVRGGQIMGHKSGGGM